MLLNLCVNARDAMPEGGRLILRAENVMLDEQFVSMLRGASPGPHVRLEVQDTGTGIPEEHQSRIFESFFTTKGEEQGTGLGLTTVRGIVKEHKGFISFATAPGKGTTFTAYLPAVSETPSASPPPQVEGAVPEGRCELILVVDDEPALRETICRTLKRHGYVAVAACDGIDGLAKFAAQQSEIRTVITDSMMPLMDGVTLCRALRALSPGTPVLVSSGGLLGKAGGAALQAFEELGVRHILHKPHTARALLAALAEALGTAETGPPAPAAPQAGQTQDWP